MASPEEYIGKTIKVSGPYYTLFDETTKRNYHFILVEDATACCQSGLEFVWNGAHSYPGDYPASNAQVEVFGVFDVYEELGATYCRLEVDDIVVL